MDDIVVIGPIRGVFHVAYHIKTANMFYSAGEFTNEALAQAYAHQLERQRISNWIQKDSYGR